MIWERDHFLIAGGWHWWVERFMHLCQQDAEAFFKALDNPPPPNDKLVEAVTLYKESSLYAPNRNT